MRFAVVLPWWGYALAIAAAVILGWLAYARVPVRLTVPRRIGLSALRTITLLLLMAILCCSMSVSMHFRHSHWLVTHSM